jgi:RNA ligase
VFFDPYTSAWRAVTRGSWKNVQTDYAHSWLEHYGPALDPKYTHCFELIAPWNRIVVAYPVERMVLIGLIETESGYDSTYAEVAQYAQTRGLEHVPYRNAALDSVKLEDESVVNFEGYVARWPGGLRVKMKYSVYLRLHRILTGLSAKGIWEALAAQTTIPLDHVPPEFLVWFDKERCAILDAYRKIENECRTIFDATDKTRTRKEIAADFVKHQRLWGILFLMLDGHNYSEPIWKMCKPTAHKTFQKDEA